MHSPFLHTLRDGRRRGAPPPPPPPASRRARARNIFAERAGGFRVVAVVVCSKAAAAIAPLWPPASPTPYAPGACDVEWGRCIRAGAVLTPQFWMFLAIFVVGAAGLVWKLRNTIRSLPAENEALTAAVGSAPGGRRVPAARNRAAQQQRDGL